MQCATLLSSGRQGRADLAAERIPFLAYLACFVLGAIVGAAVLHKADAGNLRDLQTNLDEAARENVALKGRLEASSALAAQTPSIGAPKAPSPVPGSTLPVVAPVVEVDPDVARAMELLRGRLKDPDSAIFGDVKITVGAHGKLACGFVNARNGFGGRNGMQRFVVDFDGVSKGLDSAISEGDSFTDLMWMAYCDK